MHYVFVGCTPGHVTCVQYMYYVIHTERNLFLSLFLVSCFLTISVSKAEHKMVNQSIFVYLSVFAIFGVPFMKINEEHNS